MQIFLNVPASKFALPPDRSYRCDTAQGSRGFYVRAYRALLPPHAPDMLTVRKQVIDGTGTFSLSDSQPCRLLTLLHRLSPASTLLPRDPTSAWPSAGRRCLLPAYRSHPIAHARWGALRGPMQTSQGKDTGCTAAPGPNTAPISVGFWASRSLARSPDRPGLRRASLTFGAAARLRLLPHTTSRRQAGLSRDAPTCVQLPSACGCFQLAPQRTCTSNPGSMPGTPRTLRAASGGGPSGPSLTAATRGVTRQWQVGTEKRPWGRTEKLTRKQASLDHLLCQKGE